MKNQFPDIKTSAPKRLSPDLDEVLHMLKSLETRDNSGAQPAAAR